MAILIRMAPARFQRLRRHTGKIGVLLAFALVFAQLGAITHAYAHLRAGADPQGIAAKTSHSCPDCQSFSPLLAGAGTASHTLSLLQQQTVTAPPTLLAPIVARTPQHSFQSRAPPLQS